MRILCGTDFSTHSNHTALAAASLAARLGGTLSLAHVLDPSRYSNPSKELLNHLRCSRHNKLTLLAERARRRAARVEFRIAEGAPGTKLAELAVEHRARLMILGSAGPISPSEWFTGSTTDHATQSASVPTLVIRKPDAVEAWAQNGRSLKIVVGYDFSRTAEVALHWVMSLKEKSACELTVVYVASPVNGCSPGSVPPLSPLYYPSGLRRFLQRELEEKCAALLGEDNWRICVQPDWGRPDAQLIETALDSHADLLVVGASQGKGLARLSSVSRAVLHYSPMNVACVPFPGRSARLRQSRPVNGATQVTSAPLESNASNEENSWAVDEVAVTEEKTKTKAYNGAGRLVLETEFK